MAQAIDPASLKTPQFVVELARTPKAVEEAQRLRYHVFVQELGGDGDLVDHAAGLEKDRFDPFFDHLLVRDSLKDGQVVGVYRVLRDDMATKAGSFYSESEYDLTALKASGRKLLELGRSCLHPDYRGGAAMFHLWQGLSAYVEEHAIEVLFGVASFHGTDPAALAHPLALLHAKYLAPEDLRTKATPHQPMDLIAQDQIDRKAAMLDMPALIKAYLRLGGFVGDGAYIDHAFNTTDVCLILDTARMNERQRGLYSGSAA